MLQKITRFSHVSIILRTSRKQSKIELYGHHFKNNRWQILQYIFKGLLAIRNTMQSSNSVGQIIIKIIYVEVTVSSRQRMFISVISRSSELDHIIDLCKTFTKLPV